MKSAIRSRNWVLGATLAAMMCASRPSVAAPAVVSGPYLTGVDDSSVVVRFELDTSSAATLKVTEEGAGEPSALAVQSPETVMHAVRVTGLEPGKRYQYVVRIGAASVGGGTFGTAPVAGTPVHFLVYGDNRTGTAAHASVVAAMTKIPADFLVNTGDLVQEGGRRAQWKEFFDIEGPLLRDRAVFSAIGNHERYEDDAAQNFESYFGFDSPDGGPARPYGTVALGNVRLFFLDAMHDWDSGSERAWLERELAETDDEHGRPWRIAVMHHSPWSCGHHGPNKKLVDAHVPELLAAHRVDLVLAGHDHLYERGDGRLMKYIVTGGGGGPLDPTRTGSPTTRKLEATYHFLEVSAGSDALRIVALRPDGTVLDRCGFAKGRPWDCDAPPVAAKAMLASTAPKTAPVQVLVMHSAWERAVMSLMTPPGLGLAVLGSGLLVVVRRKRGGCGGEARGRR
jgi:hypothetical protein